MAVRAAELSVLVTADVQQAEQRLESVHGLLGNLGRVAVTAGAVMATSFAGIGAAAFALGSEFDAAYDAIAIGTGAVGDALDSLKTSFQAVVASVPANFAAASQAIADLNTRTGLTGPLLEDVTKTVLEMSRVFGGDVPGNVRLATRVFGDWGIASDQMSATLDKIAFASQATGISVQNLMDLIVRFGAPLRAMNFSFDEAAALLGKWEKEGVNTELVLGSLRIAMGNFAEQNIPMRQGLEDTIAKITALGPGAEATSLAMQVFGARAGPDMAAAILEGRFALGDLVEQMGSSQGLIMDTAAMTADGAEAMTVAFNRLKLALEPLAAAVFSFAGHALLDLIERFETVQTPMDAVHAFLGSLTEAVEKMTGVTLPLNAAFDALVVSIQGVLATGENIIGFFKNNQLAADALLSALITLTSVGIARLVFALPGLIASVIASTTAFLAQAAAAGTAAIATAAAAAPFIALAAVFAAVVLAGLTVVRNWELISFAAETMVRFVQHKFEQLGTSVRETLEMFVRIGHDVVEGLRNGIAAAWASLTGWFSDRINELMDAAKSVLGISSPSAAFQKVGQNIAQGLEQGITSGSQKVVAAVRQLSAMTIANAQVSPAVDSALLVVGPTPPTSSMRPPLAPVKQYETAAPTTITVVVHGWVGSDQQIAARLREELLRIGKRNLSLGLA